MALLDARIRRSEPDAFVRRVTYWSREYLNNFPDPLERMQVYVHNDYPEGKRPGVRNYILFDDAQDTYWDEWLWNVVFKKIGDGSTPYYVVLFCSYGSPGPRPLDYECGAPLRLPPSARISLRPQDTDDGIGPAGVLLSHAEYDDVVNRFPRPVVLDDEFRSLIFDWTAGYAGAVSDFLNLVCIKQVV
ncbi:hypothetical protein FRC02_007292 [Tulasnella sp. 418]|nr:hypothetical protein FRC02_007292 [Tulasnella sp. 418]